MRRKFIFVLGAALLLFAACGSTPTQESAAKTVEPTPTPTPTRAARTVDLTGVAGYYVRADGSDTNTGISEDAPFRTLARAVRAASTTTVKTITVIGTVAGQTAIVNSGKDEILITGKPDASDSEKALLTTSTSERGHYTLEITENSNIRLERITVTTASNGSAIYVESTLTLGRDAVVFNVKRSDESRPNYGGGVLVIFGTLVMRDNAMVVNSIAGAGGGVAVVEGATLIMQDDAIISNNIADAKSVDRAGGGGIYCADGKVVLKDNAKVTGNQASLAGGILLRFSEIETTDNLQIDGSGVYETIHVTGNTTNGWFTERFGMPGGDNIRVHNN